MDRSVSGGRSLGSRKHPVVHQRRRRKDSSKQKASRSACDLCDNIIRLAEIPLEEAVYELLVGKFAELQTSQCKAHTSIIAVCEDLSRLSIWGAEIRLTKRPLERSIEVAVDYSRRLALTRLPDLNFTGPVSPGKILDPRWIEPRLLNTWRKKCHDLHGSACNGLAARKGTLSSHPDLLVDCWRMCITRTDPINADAYVALSYVWGGWDQLKASKEKLDQLMQDNALQKHEFLHKIPRTILDAIHLVASLHERYLWVDSLCVIQDDEQLKHDQINNMASIYANSCLTIVAAQGDDANYGLRGIRGISEPRCLSQEIYHIGRKHRFVHSPEVPLVASAWSGRGWTFQESLLSQRKIIFCGDRVQWQCPYAIWNEDVQPDAIVVPTFARSSLRYSEDASVNALLGTPWPDLKGYNDLVTKFSTKDLTYPEDVLLAFSGLSCALSSVFEAGFLFGIPEICFDVGFLWTGRGDLQSRPSWPTSNLPTWSWMGWMSLIDSFSWMCGCEYVKRSSHLEEKQANTSRRTLPLVRWHCYNPLDKSSRIIANSWPTQNILHTDPLPSGWTRHKHSPRQKYKAWGHQVFKDGKHWGHVSGSCSLREAEYYYMHKSDPTAEFWYPIPIRDPNLDPIIQSQGHLISCSTQRTFLRLGEQLECKWKVSLRDSSGKWVGCLELHNEKQVDFSNAATRNLPGPGDLCELVAISKGFAYNDWFEYGMAEWDLDERPKTGEKYEFYNVLWIGWHQEVALRKGVGRVYREAWLKQTLETIELILG